MSDLRQMMITKYDAIMAVKKYLDDEDRLQGKEPNERHNRWRAEVILEGTALADTPQTEKMTEEEIDTMLAKVLVGQTDCGWK